jgi:GH15 family glucan-1,4-alpha-glucosidase
MNTAAHRKIEPPIRICGSIRAEIEARGYNERLASYTRTFDGDAMDASLLVLPLYGYVYSQHPRMQSTCTRIQEKLERNGLLYRYEAGTDDGLPSTTP